MKKNIRTGIKILVINGPNLNLLGSRDPGNYGLKSLTEINKTLLNLAGDEKVSLVFFQSNHEGNIIDFLQLDSSRKAQGILINPGALTHYGYSLRDALADTGLPVVEVHLSDINHREAFRKITVLEGIVHEKVTGLKEKSYSLGLKKLINIIRSL